MRQLYSAYSQGENSRGARTSSEIRCKLWSAEFGRVRICVGGCSIGGWRSRSRVRITLCETSDAHRLFFRRTAEYGGWQTRIYSRLKVFFSIGGTMWGFDHEGECVIIKLFLCTITIREFLFFEEILLLFFFDSEQMRFKKSYSAKILISKSNFRNRDANQYYVKNIMNCVVERFNLWYEFRIYFRQVEKLAKNLLSNITWI